MRANILIVEDEQPIREMLSFMLEKEHYGAVAVETTSQAKQALTDSAFDLLLVDWMLPGGSGIEFIRSIRAKNEYKALPVIMLTAKSDESAVTQGLDVGADDYMTKPFSPRELMSRINALLRRSKALSEQTAALVVGPLELNSQTHRVRANGVSIELGHTEFKLLQCLMSSPDRVYSRAQLLDLVWGNDTYIEERTVDVHILRLRKALKPADTDTLLETVRGAGYRIKKPA